MSQQNSKTTAPVAGVRPRLALLVRLGAAALILVALPLLAVTGMWDKSAAFDEPFYIAGGGSYLRTGDAHVAGDSHPVFAPVLVGLPTLLLPLDDARKIDGWDTPEVYLYCVNYVCSSAVPAAHILRVSRLPVILLSMGLALAVFAWSRDLFGAGAGLLAAALYVFDPNVLAHGSLATTDSPVTAFCFLSLYFFWRFLRRGRRWAILPAGVFFGLAMLTKFSAVVLLPVMGVMAAIEVALPRREGEPEAAALPASRPRGAAVLGAALLAVFAIGCVLIASGYLFDYSTGRGKLEEALGPHVDGRPPIGRVSLAYLHFLNAFLPPQYANSAAWVLKRTRSGNEAFFFGKYNALGWWYYFPVAFLIKNTIPLLLLLAAGLVATVWRKGRDAVYLLLFPAVFFAISMTSTLNIGFRHILPVMPFLFVAASGAVALVSSPKAAKAVLVVAVLLVAWHAAESVMVYPDDLAYFNESVGGPAGGWKCLSDSNIDWGQDVGRIGPRLKKLGINEEVHLAVMSIGPPSASDFRFEGVGTRVEPAPGVWVVSATELVDVYVENKNRFKWLRDNFKPIDTIGHSIFIYRVTAEELARCIRAR